MDKTTKTTFYLVGGLSLLVILLSLLFLGELLLPFIIAVFGAYLLNPTILKIQVKVKNKILAVTMFIVVVAVILLATILFLGEHVVSDSKRLVSAVDTFTTQNQDQINDIRDRISTYATDLYNNDLVQDQTKGLDTIDIGDSQETLTSALSSVYTFFAPADTIEEVSSRKPWSFVGMLISMIIYLVLVLYSYDYFETRYTKYFGNLKPSHHLSNGVWKDFKISFIEYFKQRSIVVFVNIGILAIVMLFMDLPGAVILAILTGMLSYASNFHYFSLPIVSISCWVLAIESDSSFLLYFSIILGIFILITVLDSTVYFDKIMKSVNGMNPAITLLSFTLWVYVFGWFTGTLVALPLTQLIMIFMDRVLEYMTETRSLLEK